MDRINNRLLFKKVIPFLISLLLTGLNGQYGTNAQTNSWFTTKKVAANVWCIDDHGIDNMYLVTGTDRALLIDTGTGVGVLDSMVKTLTDLPVMVVNTHGHPDHAGGNFQFSDVYAHPADFELIKQFTAYENINKAIEQALNNSPVLKPWINKKAGSFDVAKLKPVTSGYVFDLGNRKLEVIEVAGHTKGSICLLDAANKLLFTGDNNNIIVWLFLDGCLPVEGYLQTLQKLQKRSAEYDTILPGHGVPLDAGFIEEQITCAKNIISGSCQGERYETFVGPALLCKYKRAGIAFDKDNIYMKKE